MLTCKKMAVFGLSAVITAAGAFPVFADDTLVSHWDSRAMAEGSEYVNIRSEADTESECVGILLPGSVVEIIGRNKDWTRVHSGSVDGFIRSDLLVSGEEARARYEAQTDAGLATVSADVLHVRSGASESGEIIGTMQAGDVLELTGHADGWYEIRFGGETAYVADEYVVPNSGIRTALTLDQYAALVDPQISGYLPAAAPAEDGGADSVPEQAAVTEQTAVTEPVYQDNTADAAPYAADPVYTDSSAYDYGTAALPADEMTAAAAPQTYETETYSGVQTAGTDLYSGAQAESADIYSSDVQTAAPDPYNAALTEETALYGDVQSYGTDDWTAGQPAAQVTNVSSSDLDLLAAIIQCEAGGESREGKVAVGACVLNRVEDDYFPDTIPDVIYDGGQFTPAMTGVLAQTLAEGPRDDCYEAAQAALAGENPIGDLLYFHAGGGSGLTIGNQTFY